MDFQYFGGNCVKISYKKANIIVDDNLKDLGLKTITKSDDVALFTTTHDDLKVEPKLLIDQPGEYEVADIMITGIAARSHIGEENTREATMYKLEADDLKVAIVGHIYPKLSEAQLEALGVIDILVVPVGGGGYTLDGEGANKIIKAIEPKVIIPTHYDEPGIKFSVPQVKLTEALKAIDIEADEPVAKLKLKKADLLEDKTSMVVLSKQ